MWFVGQPAAGRCVSRPLSIAVVSSSKSFLSKVLMLITMITSLEELVGIITACIPKLRPLFRPKGVSNDDHQSAKSDDLYHQNGQKRFRDPYSITRALRSTTEDLDGTSGDRSFSDASAEQILVPINGSEWIKPRTDSPLMSP